MKKYIISFTIICMLLFQANAQTNTKTGKSGGSSASGGGTSVTDILNGAGKILGGSGGSGILNDAQLEGGMRDALTQCLTNGTNSVAVKDGFFKNIAIKILFPKEATIVENTLRKLGFNSICDQAIEKFNLAAEDASSKAKPIFTNALKQMTIKDVSAILLGADNSCTEYFKKTTTAQLTAEFSPVVNNSLSTVGATQAWAVVMKSYNKIPFVKPVNVDLGEYVTGKAIDGLFYMIAKEELKVRQNISSRSTPLMKDVFNWVDKQKSGVK